jgi:hypothetical protein
MHSSFILLASLSAAFAFSRSRTSFDTSWRFHLGDLPAPLPTCDTAGFTTNLTGTQCLDQHRSPATTQAACEAACCNDVTCLVWQWCAAPSCGGADGGCWLGSNVSACDKPGPGWVSFARPQPSPAPPPPPPPPCVDPADPCSTAFADGAWRIVNTPHDFVVEGAPTATADRGHGYLPFNISWYRKHWTVDPLLQGAAIWLEFDGVYRNCDCTFRREPHLARAPYNHAPPKNKP